MVTQPTTREMRGMAIANTIGRRNNPDVSIQRMNKLTYKVKSQSNHEKWYTFIDTYNEGWTCDCADFTFRHFECKHIHAVKFSKLLRKKIYFDTFSNIPITESKLGEIICQKCGSPNYKKFGIRHNKDSGDIQRYLCKDCEYRFIVNPAFENCKASAKIITAAIDPKVFNANIWTLEIQNCTHLFKLSTLAAKCSATLHIRDLGADI